MLTNFFHNTELSLYQLSSLFNTKDLSLLEVFLLSESLNSLTVPVFVPSCQAAPALQGFGTAISPLKISDTARDGFHPADAAEKDRRQDNLRDTKYIFCRHASVGHPASAIQVPDRRCKTRQGSWQRQTAPCTPPSLCRLHFQNGLPAAATAPLPAQGIDLRSGLCGNTQSSKKRSLHPMIVSKTPRKSPTFPVSALPASVLASPFPHPSHAAPPDSPGPLHWKTHRAIPHSGSPLPFRTRSSRPKFLKNSKYCFHPSVLHYLPVQMPRPQFFPNTSGI